MRKRFHGGMSKFLSVFLDENSEKEYIGHDTRCSMYYLPGKCIQSLKSMPWKMQSQAIGMVLFVRSLLFLFLFTSGNNKAAFLYISSCNCY